MYRYHFTIVNAIQLNMCEQLKYHDRNVGRNGFGDEAVKKRDREFFQQA